MNNAGNHCKKYIWDMSVEDYKNVLDVHLVGAFALTKAFIPQMKERGFDTFELWSLDGIDLAALKAQKDRFGKSRISWSDPYLDSGGGGIRDHSECDRTWLDRYSDVPQSRGQ